MEDIMSNLAYLKANKAQVTIKMSDGNVTSGRIDDYNRDALYFSDVLTDEINGGMLLHTTIVFLHSVVSISYYTAPEKKGKQE